jgi:hypothetical protein
VGPPPYGHRLLGGVEKLWQPALLHDVRQKPEVALRGTEYFADQYDAQ